MIRKTYSRPQHPKSGAYTRRSSVYTQRSRFSVISKLPHLRSKPKKKLRIPSDVEVLLPPKKPTPRIVLRSDGVLPVRRRQTML